jgi:hypothetical protein
LRLAQTAALTLSKVGMVSTVDLGDPTSPYTIILPHSLLFFILFDNGVYVHSRRKLEVGYRVSTLNTLILSNFHSES